MTGKNRTYLDCLRTGCNDQLGIRFCHQLILGYQHIAVIIKEVFCKVSACKTLFKRLNKLLAFAYLVDIYAVCSSAIIGSYYNFLRYINKTSCKITRVGGS